MSYSHNREQHGGSWSQFASNTSIANNTVIRQTNTGFNDYGKTYYWRLCLTDGCLWENQTYHFKTGVIETSVNTIPPYTIASNSLTLNASGPSDLTNVTLHYGYTTKSISGWGTLSVTMPLMYEPPHFRFFEWLFERFPHAFPFLRLLFNR